MEKTIAVVVTYNRCALLAECITALRNQTQVPDAILVVNNGSTDNTEEWLCTQKDLFFITQKNLGSGGGFYTGIHWAFTHQYSWIWCMDDDGYPKSDALENLLSADVPLLSLRNCAVINKADKKSFVWKTGNYTTIEEVNVPAIEGIAHPFNGTLLHRNIIERVGLPKPQLFVWGDESEYYYRITQQNNIPVYTIANSVHYHPAAVFSYKKDWDYEKSWKMYFYVRNRLKTNQSKFSNRLTALGSYCFFLLAMVGIILLFQKTNKLKKLRFLSWPVTDAFINDYAATPQFILERLSGKSNGIFRSSMQNYARNIWSAVYISFQPIRARNAAHV